MLRCLKYFAISILAPTDGPSSITATNTSSSSISISWDDVPAEHQNGIITGYKVYIRKEGSSGTWYKEDTSSKQLSKSGLDLWTTYDVKISAKTSIGEGVKSTIVKVRTDEDGKRQFWDYDSIF